MTIIKKIIGSYDHILRQSYCPQAFIDGLLADNDYEKTLDTILGDLPRGAFFETNGKTFDDLIETWINPNISTAYNQGNINASFFNEIILRYLQSDNFLGSNPHRTDDNFHNYYANDMMVQLNFAYFDDNGIPCGVMFHGARFDPDTWAVAIIRNTTAAPNQRDVMLLCAEDVIKQEAVSATRDARTFDDFLNSQEISRALRGVFLENNQLNSDKLDRLQERLSRIEPEQEETLIKKKAQLSALVRGYWQQADKEEYQRNIDRISKHIEQLQSDKPFIRRQAVNLIGALIATTAVVGLLLAASGLLAPLGIVFAASVVTYSLIASVVCSAVALFFLSKIVRSEQSIMEARQELASYHSKSAALESKHHAMIHHIMSNDLDNDAFKTYCESLTNNPKKTDSIQALIKRHPVCVTPSHEHEPRRRVRFFDAPDEHNVSSDDDLMPPRPD